MDDSTFHAVVVGNGQSAEMQPVGDILRRELSGWTIDEHRHLRELIERVERDHVFPDLVVICQHWRDEYSPETVRKAFQTLPLARWICLAGAWCESEGRHGSRWPAAVRVSWAGFETRLLLERDVIRGQVPALALTAARDEIVEFDARAPVPGISDPAPTVSLSSPDREIASWLWDLCQLAGFSLASLEDQASPDVWLVDGDPCCEAMREKIRTFRQQHPQTLIVVFLGIVYPEDQRRLSQEGADLVLSKLTPIAGIVEKIQQKLP